MTDDYGNLSIDFLAGFTIFLLAFIWVVSMIPGLLIGLQAYTIDYDAVAYRTGVILAEDPGWPVSPAWESYEDPQKFNITRFGLAISRDTPNILSQDKINRFFNISTTDPSVGFIYPDDYQQRAIFGDFPYRFRISLRDIDEYRTRNVGERLPPGYGSIRRVVKIKGTSNATINASYIQSHSWSDKYKAIAYNATTHVFSISINNTQLLGEVRNPAYQIDPSREQITIKITDLRSTITDYPPAISNATSTITLEDMKVYKLDAGIYSNVPLPASNNPFVDGNRTRLPSSWPATPAPVNDNITLQLNPQYIESMKAQNSQIFIALKFNVNPASTFLNNTQAVPDFSSLDGKLTYENANTTPFMYDYNPANVTQPALRDAILEVAVWSGETMLEPITALFADDFDSVTSPSGWSLVGWVERWPATPHYGVASVILRDVPSSMNRTISTTGYSDISVSFDMGSKVNAGHDFKAEWSSDGGTTWNLLKQINNGDPEDDNDLHPFSYLLPASAENNANFKLGFVLNANVPGEKGYIDNVVVGGIPY
jgi:hypothetical protein